MLCCPSALLPPAAHVCVYSSENDPLSGLPASQLYFMFAMADGGRDLEAYQVAGYDQARSALLQVRGRVMSMWVGGCGWVGGLAGWWVGW